MTALSLKGNLIQYFSDDSEESHEITLALDQVSISSTYLAHIFRTKVLFSSYVLETKSTFVQKTRAKNVDEIDSR